MIDLELLREYALSLPITTEDTAFGPDVLLIRVCGKIFVCMDLATAEYVTVKCDPDKALLLRDRFADVEPAWHWNKRYWNQLRVYGSLNDEFAREAVLHSYSEVVRKLPLRIRREHPEITALKSSQNWPRA